MQTYGDRINDYEIEYIKKFFTENPIAYSHSLALALKGTIHCRTYVLRRSIEELKKSIKDEIGYNISRVFAKFVSLFKSLFKFIGK